MKRLKTIALLAREPGALVCEALIASDKIDLLRVFTYGNLPRGEGGGERPELGRFIRACSGVPLTVVRGNVHSIPEYMMHYDYDLLVSLSWRHKIHESLYGRAKVAAINIHRGDLPKYPGAEPVRRMIEAGELEAVVSVHHIVDEIDAGRVICKASIPMSSKDPEEMKRRLYPVYSPLMDMAINIIHP